MTETLPQWMTEKLAKIAAKRKEEGGDIWQDEQDELTILAAELRCFPQMALTLPATFRAKVQAQTPRELEPCERAALILSACDWRDVADAFPVATTADKVQLKLGALAFAIRQGGVA